MSLIPVQALFYQAQHLWRSSCSLERQANTTLQQLKCELRVQRLCRDRKGPLVRGLFD
ncbi:MAG: hypothetical protein LW884_08050 [Bacteroidetes bacterium]|jgi:hypothetical protein|nr:hypothetical protein [Bacteroidota bacterium]